MYAGRAREIGTADDIFYQPVNPYTWGLYDSLPRHDLDEKGRLCPIQGQPPSLIHLPSGCPFHPRCPYAQPVCAAKEPPLLHVGGAHRSACHFSNDPEFKRLGTVCADPDSGVRAL
jgi:oligopeptide transport system ATP-binding protein